MADFKQIEEGNTYRKKSTGEFIHIKEVTRLHDAERNQFMIVASDDCTFEGDSKTTIGRQIINAHEFWEIYKEEVKVKCIYCKKPIHIDKFAGVNKEGIFCNGVTCLIELSKTLDNEEEITKGLGTLHGGEDNWNLADKIITADKAIQLHKIDSMNFQLFGELIFSKSNVKTFIQKSRKDMNEYLTGYGVSEEARKSCFSYMDKRAGKL